MTLSEANDKAAQRAELLDKLVRTSPAEALEEGAAIADDKSQSIIWRLHGIYSATIAAANLQEYSLAEELIGHLETASQTSEDLGESVTASTWRDELVTKARCFVDKARDSYDMQDAPSSVIASVRRLDDNGDTPRADVSLDTIATSLPSSPTPSGQ